MAHPRTGTRLGGNAFNHGPSADAEREYDRLRDLARREHGQRQHFSSESQQAYKRGDGAEAHRLSEQSKQHGAQADAYNRQASEFIFRENNAVGKVPGDTIDLHGQFVEEAEEILEQRIRYAQSTGQSHLHVIVGKGNHSPGHIQKIKPRVEQVCRELGLNFRTEENEGRMYIDLGGHGQQPQFGGYEQHHQPQHPQYGQPMYETAYPMGNKPNYGQAGGYPGSQSQSQMQYQQPQQQQQQFGYQEPPQQRKNDLCCGLCTVM